MSALLALFLGAHVLRAHAAEPVRVGIAGLSASPAASSALEDVSIGLAEALRAILAADGHLVGDRFDDLFHRELPDVAVIVGGYARRAVCARRTEFECTVKVRWELYDVRARRVVRAYTVTADATGPDRVTAAQRAVGTSLFRALRKPEFRDGIPATSELPPPAWASAVNLPACAAPPVSLPGDVASVLDSVVIVRTDDGTGSGVLVSPDGHVATAAHVVEGESHVEVVLRGGAVVEATVARVDTAFDVALLDLPGTGWPCRALATAAPTLGTPTFVVGAPLGPELGWSLSRGVVSGERKMGGGAVVQTDASINPGNSGGPLFDDKGTVTAIVSFKAASVAVEGLGFGVTAGTWTSRLNTAKGPSGVVEGPVEAWPFVDAGAEPDPKRSAALEDE